MKSFIMSVRNALKGLKIVCTTERNFKIMLALFMGTVLLSLWLGITRMEWMIILIVSGGVLGAEMFNTAVENLVDFISPEYHYIAGLIKDIAAGAVLLMSVIAVIIGVMIFLPYIWSAL